MKMRVVAVCFALSAVLPASAFHPGRTDPAGYPIVVPPVRSLTPASGRFVLPAELTVSQGVGFDLSALERTYASEVAGGHVRTVSDGALCRFSLSDKGVPDSCEGYRLVIAPDGIRVTAQTATGLYYGEQTLGWILRNREGDALKACTIEDSPSLRLRGVLLEMNDLRPDQMARQCEMLEGLAALKYNAVLCDFADNLPLSIAGDFRRKTTLTKENVAAFVATAKRCHLQIIPYVQVLSHAYWMSRHKDWDSLKEADPKDLMWNSCYCPKNPEACRIVDTVIRETCDLFRPKLFQINLDELKGCPHQICPKCRNEKWADLIVDHAKPICDRLLARGIHPIIAQDEFTRKSMTRDYMDLVEVPERLGKETVICLWQYEDNPTDAQWLDFKERGFSCHYMSYSSPNNVMQIPKLAARIGANGSIVSFWLKLPSTFDRVCHTYSPRHCANAIYQAVYSWNAGTEEYNRLPFDPLVAFRQTFGPTAPVKFAGPASSVPLGAAATALVGGGDARFPVLDGASVSRIVRDAAQDGFRLETAKGGTRLKAAVLAGRAEDEQLPKRAEIAFAGRAEGFSLLVAAAPLGTFDIGNNQPIVARLRVRYVDGREEAMQILLHGDIAPWNGLFGGVRTRFVSRINDAKGLTVNLCATDWKNPRPEVAISGLALQSTCEKGVLPILFGVVARGAKDVAPTVAAKAVEPLDLCAQGTDSFQPVCPLETESDIRKLTMYCNSVRDGKHVAVPFKRKIVEDSVHGKVLEVFVPKSVPTPVNTRLHLTFPTSPTQDFATVRTSIFCDRPQYITRSDMYLGARFDGHCAADAAIGVVSGLTPGWTSLSVSRARFRNKEGGGAKSGFRTGIVVAFFLTPGEDMVFRFKVPELTMRAEACRIDVRARVE